MLAGLSAGGAAIGASFLARPSNAEGALVAASNLDAPLQAPGFPDWTDEEWATLSQADWEERLSPAAFKVLRQDGTERAFTSSLNTEKRDGWYSCAGCGLTLFSSAHKYDSGTGWPSFYQAIPNRLGTSVDRKLFYPRTEYHCVRCGGHQGHVFDDGPRPTGQRWCNNGVALVFTPSIAKAA
ncbi:MAG: peptide-methionine (R)-S-oxide reductase MsrB [Pseudomonadota bacterium]